MEWMEILSECFTNGIRVFLCFYLVVELSNVKKIMKKSIFFVVVASIIVTSLGCFQIPEFNKLGLEVCFVLGIVRVFYGCEIRMSLFLSIFYEIGVTLWEFMISIGLAFLFSNNRFMEENASEYMLAIWSVRMLMVIVALLVRGRRISGFRMASIIAVLTLFGMIQIAEQKTFAIEEEVISAQKLLAVIFMVSILIYKLSQQYEMEKEVTRLKTEQSELLKSDYQNLNQIYTANAKLYHDLHNHIEVMYGYLKQEKTTEAIRYLEELRTPIEEITQKIWTGDKAIDYLINSKLAIMHKKQIQVKTNIEFPRNTNIGSADLTAILGNLLDNAIEAVQKCDDKDRFIYLTIRRINNFLIIKVENSYKEEPVMENGQIRSTKENKKQHGWGLKSVKTAVEHYDGAVETSFENQIFCVVVTLFYQ